MTPFDKLRVNGLDSFIGESRDVWRNSYISADSASSCVLAAEKTIRNLGTIIIQRDLRE